VNEALRIQPNYGPAIEERCRINVGMGKYREALADANKAINLAVNNREKGRLYGLRSAFQQGFRNYDAVVRDCSEALRLGYTRAIVYRSRAEGYYGLQLWDNAIADASTAIRLGENHEDLAEAYQTRSSAYLQKDLYDDAIQDLTRALALQPTAKLYVYRGLAQKCKRDYLSAARDGNSALALDPKNAQAHWLLAECCSKFGDQQAAAFHNERYGALLHEQGQR
jgi:tetratricopeptide (TPR) repeat protein